MKCAVCSNAWPMPDPGSRLARAKLGGEKRAVFRAWEATGRVLDSAWTREWRGSRDSTGPPAGLRPTDEGCCARTHQQRLRARLPGILVHASAAIEIAHAGRLLDSTWTREWRGSRDSTGPPAALRPTDEGRARAYLQMLRPPCPIAGDCCCAHARSHPRSPKHVAAGKSYRQRVS